MRIRTIKPEFWDHPVMSRLEDSVRLLAIGLLSMADDEGFLYADAKRIRNGLWPWDDDSVRIQELVNELSMTGYIEIRQHPTHGAIAKIISFLSHQVINRPKASKLSALWNSVSDHRLVIEDSMKDGPSFRDASMQEGKGKEGNKEQGKEGNEASLSLPLLKEDKSKSRCTLEEARAFAVEIGLPATDGESCFHKWEGSGWKNGGHPIKDWKATVRAWKSQGYLPSQKTTTRKTPAPHAGIQTPGKFEMP